LLGVVTSATVLLVELLSLLFKGSSISFNFSTVAHPPTKKIKLKDIKLFSTDFFISLDLFDELND
jgi:hypothetical protein